MNAKPSFGLVYTVDADMRRKEQERAMEQDWRKKRLNIAETPPPPRAVAHVGPQVQPLGRGSCSYPRRGLH